VYAFPKRVTLPKSTITGHIGSTPLKKNKLKIINVFAFFIFIKIGSEITENK
jgi:hypothetical protein